MYHIPFLDLPPLNGASGTVRLPGSKSISNRVLLLAGLAAGHDRRARPAGQRRHARDAGRAGHAGLRPALGRRRPPACAAPHRPGRAAGGARGRSVPGQRRHGDAPAGRGAGRAGGHAGRQLHCCAACRACTSAPSATWWMRCALWAATIDDLGTPGYPPLRLSRPAPAAGWPPATPIRVRGDVSSQFLTALLLALPLVSADREIVIEVEGELISQPYIDITLNLLARFGIAVQQQGWQRFVIPPGSAYRTPGSLHVEGDASSASYFIAHGRHRGQGRCTAAHRRCGQRQHPGRHPLRRRRRGHGRAGQERPGLAGSAPRPLAAGGHHARLQAHPRRRDDAGRDGAVRRQPDAADRHRQLAREGDRPHRRDGRRSCAKSAQQVVEGADFIEVQPLAAADWRAAAIHTYDDHRMAMCLSLAAFHPLAADNASARRRAAAHPRPTLRRQDLPRLLRSLVRCRHGRRQPRCR